MPIDETNSEILEVIWCEILQEAKHEYNGCRGFNYFLCPYGNDNENKSSTPRPVRHHIYDISHIEEHIISRFRGMHACTHWVMQQPNSGANKIT